MLLHTHIRVDSKFDKYQLEINTMEGFSLEKYIFSDLDLSNCVTEQDIAYYGNDVNDGNSNIQPNVDSCRSSCDAIHAPYFSYHPKTTKACMCKSTDAGRTTLNDAVSGASACAG